MASPIARRPAEWTSGLSLAAALGAVFAARRPRPTVAAVAHEAQTPMVLPADFVVRHRIDGRVTAVEGDPAENAGLLGYGLVDQMHSDDRAEFLAHICDVAADGRARATSLRMRRSDAEFRRLDVTTSRPDDAGALISAFRESAAARDLNAELEQAREEAQLERSLKDRLLANMSHELRTPLNAILGFSEILADPKLSPADPDKRLEYARIIHTSADHLLSVVNLVLDMSRIEAGKFAVSPAPLELTPLIRECCDMLHLRAKAGGVEIVVSPLPFGF